VFKNNVDKYDTISACGGRGGFGPVQEAHVFLCLWLQNGSIRTYDSFAMVTREVNDGRVSTHTTHMAIVCVSRM
jgi:hypothetical protein